jgi:hypothetical protein
MLRAIDRSVGKIATPPPCEISLHLAGETKNSELGTTRDIRSCSSGTDVRDTGLPLEFTLSFVEDISRK